MIIDDNGKNTNLKESLSRHADCEVISINSGTADLDAIRQEMPDLILVDMRMPGMEGMQIVQEIRQDEHVRHIPVIGMSEYATPSIWNRALRSGMTGFFEKPINRERLIELSQRLMSSVAKTA